MRRNAEAVMPTNRHRWKSIAQWIKDTSYDFVNRVNTIIQVEGTEEGFRNFLFGIDYIDDIIVLYALEKSFLRYGKTECCRVLFNIMFSRRLSEEKAKHRIKYPALLEAEQEVKVEEYRKKVMVGNEEFTLFYIRIKDKFYKRAKDSKGRFRKVPEEYKDVT